MRASVAIARRLQATSAYRTARVIMAYLTHGSEVPTERIIEQAWKDGKKVAVPAVEQGGKLSAAIITSLTDELVSGAFGIREPDRTKCGAAEADTIDLVLVPAFAFDKAGHRVGYGEGYYDRWLPAFSRQKRIGLAFDFQVVSRVPNHDGDVPVGLIVTDRRLVRAAAGRKTKHISPRQ